MRRIALWAFVVTAVTLIVALITVFIGSSVYKAENDWVTWSEARYMFLNENGIYLLLEYISYYAGEFVNFLTWPAVIAAIGYVIYSNPAAAWS